MAPLKEIRVAKGFLQKELANATCIKIRSLRYYESGKRIPDVITAQRFAKVLGVEVSDIYPLPD